MRFCVVGVGVAAAAAVAAAVPVGVIVVVIVVALDCTLAIFCWTASMVNLLASSGKNTPEVRCHRSLLIQPAPTHTWNTWHGMDGYAHGHMGNMGHTDTSETCTHRHMDTWTYHD